MTTTIDLPPLANDPAVSFEKSRSADVARRSAEARRQLEAVRSQLAGLRSSAPGYAQLRADERRLEAEVQRLEPELRESYARVDQAETAASTKMLKQHAGPTDRANLAKIAAAAIVLCQVVDHFREFRRGLEAQGFNVRGALPDLMLPPLGDVRVRDSWIRRMLDQYAEAGVTVPAIEAPR